MLSTGSDGRANDEVIRKALNFAHGHQVFLDGKPSSCLEQDIIFGNGSFLVYPRLMARPCGPSKIAEPSTGSAPITPSRDLPERRP